MGPRPQQGAEAVTPQAVRETGDGAEEANGPVPMGGQPASEAPAPPSVPREELVVCRSGRGGFSDLL